MMHQFTSNLHWRQLQTENLEVMIASASFRPAVLGVFLLLGFGPLGVQGDEPPEDEAAVLDPVIVVASRTPRPLSGVAAQVTVIDAADIRQGLVEDVDGLLRYEPGLELEISGTRFGATGINVRGIGGNRVAIEQDGLTVRDRFVVGAFADSGRSLIETDRIKRVEVLYGPASVLYGSDALGGVIAITTWDPDDLLARTSRGYWLGLRGGYQGADDSWVASGMLAAGAGAHGLLLAGAHRSGHQLKNRAPAGTPQDPQDWGSDDFMLRYACDTPGGNRLRLTAMGQDTDVDTTMFSQLGYGRRFGTTTSLAGSDHDRNGQFALDFTFDWSGWEQGELQLFYTRYETEQLTREVRGRAIVPVALEREFDYDQEHAGLDFSLFRSEHWGGAQHRLGIGLQLLQTDTSEMRDGLQTNLQTGSTSNVILGEVFPVRDFPDSRSREVGLWAQDEITLAGGRWDLIPALRWDHYSLDPRPDSLWLEDFPDTEVVPVTDSELTPRLGLVYHMGNGWNAYAQYAHGFRAPPFEDANIGLDLPLFGYRAIPNPGLESETSNGFEIGIRRFSGGSAFSLAAFDTEYDNFIESRALIGMDEVSGDLLFQSRNIDKARIYGADLRFDQDLSRWSGRLEGWSLRLAAYWARGENRESGEPLNSIAPPQAVVGVTWDSPGRNWQLGAAATLTAAKQPGDIDETGGGRFATPSWTTVDVTAAWRAADWLELRAGVFNVGNRTYWRWLDVARLDAGDPMIPLLSRPGRNCSVTARFSY